MAEVATGPAKSAPAHVTLENGDVEITIQKGDTLWKYAKENLGSGLLWTEIQKVEANKDTAKDPLKLQPKDKIIIPKSLLDKYGSHASAAAAPAPEPTASVPQAPAAVVTPPPSAPVEVAAKPEPSPPAPAAPSAPEVTAPRSQEPVPATPPEIRAEPRVTMSDGVGITSEGGISSAALAMDTPRAVRENLAHILTGANSKVILADSAEAEEKARMLFGDSPKVVQLAAQALQGKELPPAAANELKCFVQFPSLCKQGDSFFSDLQNVISYNPEAAIPKVQAAVLFPDVNDPMHQQARDIIMAASRGQETSVEQMTLLLTAMQPKDKREEAAALIAGKIAGNPKPQDLLGAELENQIQGRLQLATA